jgi:hypothetical protein
MCGVMMQRGATDQRIVGGRRLARQHVDRCAAEGAGRQRSGERRLVDQSRRRARC